LIIFTQQVTESHTSLPALQMLHGESQLVEDAN